MRSYTNFPKWAVYGRKFGKFALVAVTLFLVNAVHERMKLHSILKVTRQTESYADHENSYEWVNFSNDDFRIYAYSAFYDDRPSLLSDSVIRIIAVSDPYESLKTLNNTQLYCILHHNNGSITLRMTDVPKEIGYGWDLNKRTANEYVYTCRSVKGMIPYAVTIDTAQHNHSSARVSVTVPNKPEKQRDFCICPQAVYGLRLDPYRLIEWMEMQKILGVSLVGIYVLSASDLALKVFKHYVAEGFVEMREMRYIYAPANDPDSEFWLHLTPAINDCIYRHMYEFKKIAVMDFDEIIMPRKQHNLPDLVTYLDQTFLHKKSRKVNYAFRNNYFFSELSPDDNISPNFAFLRFRRKVPVSPEGYAMKSIIDPQACTNMHNHVCWGVTANYSKYDNTAFVDPEIALNQHYKKCHFSHKTCDNLFKNATQDDVMLRVKDILSRNVGDKIKAITGKDT